MKVNVSMPKISIIVPLYNSEKYLARCIKSILNQTFKNFELILVDDGSIDGSLSICEGFAEKDTRIKVIHKENGGVSTARNTGLEIAVGDYITFVDSDDYIEPNMYEQMMNKALEYDCDVVLCDCLKEFDGYSEIYSHNIRSGFYDYKRLKTEYYPHLLVTEKIEYPATISNCRLLWKNALNTPQMRYEQGIRYSEDLLFGAKLIYNAKSFYYMKGCAYYHYVINNDSASHTYAPDKWTDYLKLHDKIKEAFGGKKIYDFSKQIDMCLLFFVYNTVGEDLTAAISKAEKKNKIKSILSTTCVRSMFNRIKICSLDIPLKLKILTVFYKYQIGISSLITYYEVKNEKSG